MTGEVLAGRYRLERELGRGGMATVFLATDLRLSRPVALKRMHPGDGTGRAERFRREAELAASLHHPNVLEVHDYGEDGEHGPFLVCEWVRGEDLRALAGRLSPVPPEAVMVLGWELARALAAAHARGIVHRDVKPDNVLVAEGGPLKLADFGLAALEDQERLTSTGAVTGSLPYMAPERIDTGAYSPASDVYAVGVILFELCSGTTPHAGKGAAHLALSVMTKEAPSLTEVVPGTPEPLASLVARCLAKDARDRPRDGAVLAAALEELLQRGVGPPAEVAREFLSNPVAVVSRWRRARFERLLEEGRGLLARGEGARAAKVLNAALVLEPASAEVVALLRERPRRSGWRAGAVGAGLVFCAAVGWGGWSLVRRSGTEASGRVVASANVRSGEVVAAGRVMSAQWDGENFAAVAMIQEREREKPSRGAESPSGQVSPEPVPVDDATAAAEQPRVPTSDNESPLPRTDPSTRDASRGRGRSEEVASVKPGGASAPTGRSDEVASTKPVGSPVPKGRSEEGTPGKPGGSPVPTGRSTRGEPVGASQSPVPTTSPGVGTTAPARPAVLKVTARPWAEVFVNGESRGYTPRVRELSLPAGTYQLRFVNPLCDEVDQEVTLAPGETVVRDVVLSLRKAEVLILAPAGARLFVDGREVGVAPLSGPVAVEHGRHTVTARRAGAPPLQREVDVVAGRRLEVTLDVTP
ncbi:serine/threonine-protein kinase [Myxococcus qinghaiensis]|uniref:serine/threonine-protein kinase n=1 Tax=Myxococcus qinghaiensis TaxID=2906758 RepID=UPI0020A7491A|nr:serine/threonine-protein kinase [Myxococcus qinghaiensis]MCP3163561.1 protein kinase [Myxococcus qinghaiensis]